MKSHPQSNTESKRGIFEQFSVWVGRATGTTAAFIFAAGSILLWACLGPIFNFSSQWQLFVNTGTTIITFLMVFVIQRAQNKESVAIQLKLNELVAAHEFSSNRLVSVEDLNEEDLKVLQEYYRSLAEMSKGAANLQVSHSIEEAKAGHIRKFEQSALRKTKNKNNDPKGHTISSNE